MRSSTTPPSTTRSMLMAYLAPAEQGALLETLGRPQDRLPALAELGPAS